MSAAAAMADRGVVTTENNSSLQKSGREFETLLSSCNQLHFWRD